MSVFAVGCSDDGDSAAGKDATSTTIDDNSANPTDAPEPEEEPPNGLDPEAIDKADAEAAAAAANGEAPETPEVTSATVPTPPDTPTTEYVEAKSGLPDVAPTNGRGDPIVLDETALLACAQNQIAWVELQSGSEDRAADALKIAARRAETSAVSEIKDFAPTLKAAAGASAPKADVDRFLKLCTERGFEY